MTAWSHDKPVPPRRSPEQIADYREWAQFTRALMGWADITGGETALPARESRLRKLAAEQAREAAQQPRIPAIGTPASGRWLAGIKTRQQPCPGEFGPGGTFREHCPQARTQAAP